MSTKQNAGAREYLITPPVVYSPPPQGCVAASSMADAEFLPLPPNNAKCRFTSLSRSTLINMIRSGEIKALKLRRPGCVRGRVLILKSSLAEYLHRQLAEQMACHQAPGRRAS